MHKEHFRADFGSAPMRIRHADIDERGYALGRERRVIDRPKQQ